ncbi:MAG: autorepressor SdpR family transcription factor [Thermoanaerobacterales bacterium]|nr:autorepressor SdpR family transcription factor [Thermoanaerobacterales bacterium]
MGLNALFKALSDETRREILRLLAARGDLAAGEIADAFPLSRPTISHHLNVLKDAGLILDERRGQHIIYSLNTTVFQDLSGWLFAMVQSVTRKNRNERREGQSIEQ